MFCLFVVPSMGVELTSPAVGGCSTVAVSPGSRHPSLPRQGKSHHRFDTKCIKMYHACFHMFSYAFVFPYLSVSSCHGESHPTHVFRSVGFCCFVCSMFSPPELPHISKAMSKAAGKGSVPPPPPSGMIHNGSSPFLARAWKEGK